MHADASSPVFAGRGAELSALTRAFEAAAAGTPTVALIGAEAGGGKSRLVAEFAAAVNDRALVLTGGCVEVSAGGLPYAPFTAALRELTRSRGAAEVAALVPDDGAGELAGILPRLGTPAPPPGDPETARARLFERVLLLLETLAEQRPLVLVLEDVHWADQATCDLLMFLARSLRQAPVLLVSTFRSDEVERPLLRSLLAGLGRSGGATRLELDRLSRDQVGVQLEGILGRSPGAALTDAVYARGGGIPLFTEALVRPDGTLDPGLPWSLRDLLLAVVQELSERTRHVLGMAAVGGDRVGHELLATVTGLDDLALTAELRPALARGVLVGDAAGYAFRHHLFWEAVLQSLPPGERIRAHRAYAGALEATPRHGLDGETAIELALHWRGAREDERALIAAWQAATGSGAAFAYAARLQMLEQVLELWSAVPDAARTTGTDHAGVLEMAADSARWAGEPERGLALVEGVLAEVGAGDPERRATALRRRAGLRRELLLPGQLADLFAALDLASAPTPARAHVMAQLCWALRREDRHDEAQRFADELLALGRRLGDDERRVEAEMLLAAEGAHRGQDTGAALRRAREDAARIGADQLEVWAGLTASHVLEGRGSYEAAIEAARDGLARARELGLGRQIAAPIAGNLAESLASTGRWDEALEILDEILGLDQPPLGRVHPLLVRGHIAVGRGDLDAASRAVDALRSLPAGVQAEAQHALPLARLEIDRRLLAGDLAGALAATLAIPGFQPGTDPRYPWALLATAMQACAEASAARLAPSAGDPAQLRMDLELRAAAVPRLTPLHEAWTVMFAAEAVRAGGRQDLAAWDAAAAAWQDLGQPHPAAYSLLQAAGAAAAAGSRDGAAGRLRHAANLAGRLGARPLLQRIGRMARRAGVDLPASGDAASAVPFGLTRRELEVLRLVAVGRANRDIAAELFISPKTASVHVSNILAKLGVATRVEAAATAHRLRLLDEG